MNDLGPAKFTTQADNGTEQICYYNRNKKDTSFNFNSFLAVRKETSSSSEIIFFIVRVIYNLNRHSSICSEISDELSDFKNDIVQRGGTIQRTSEGDSFRETNDDGPNQQQRSTDRRVSKKPRLFSGY